MRQLLHFLKATYSFQHCEYYSSLIILDERELPAGFLSVMNYGFPTFKTSETRKSFSILC